MKIKDIVIIGMLSATLTSVKFALSFLPNIELVSILIIVYTLVFGRKALCSIYVFIIVEALIYGMGLWWFNYLYIWTILYLVVRLLRNQQSPLLWAIVSGAYGLSFGALCSIPYFITGGIPSGIAYWAAGIPFDIVHGISNFCIAIAVFVPFYYIMKHLKGSFHRQTDIL